MKYKNIQYPAKQNSILADTLSGDENKKNYKIKEGS
jgi:hypothetical protein